MVTVSGKLFQLNINSALSLQLRAGFASASPGGSSSANRLTSRQEEDSETKRYEEAAYYEVVDASEEPSAGTYSPMIGLPASTVENQALPAVEPSYKNDLPAKIQRTEAETYRRFADEGADRSAYVQSYDRNGHRMLAFLQTPTIDFVV